VVDARDEDLRAVTASFASHLSLLDLFLASRSEILERIDRALLNVRGKPVSQSRDRRVFERLFDTALFGCSSLPSEYLHLKGDLHARRIADGFEPVVTGRHVHDLDPLELILRAYEHWGATRWPGSSGRLAYAGVLYATWMAQQLGLLSLRIWDDGDVDAGDRIAGLQQRLDRLNAFSVDDVMVRDVAWLLQATLGPLTRHLEPYLVVADRIDRSLPPGGRLGIHAAGAKLAGGHLRSQLRYRCEEAGRSIDDPESLAITRNSNSLDAALLVGDLVPLLEAYRAALRVNDDARRLELADAILQGLSADPELFVVRWDLLVPSTIIETAFIARDHDGKPHYTPLGGRHIERLGHYRGVMTAVTAELREDTERLAPVPGAYSPYGVSYGFITDVLANMAMARLVGQPSAGLSLEDAFASRGRLAEKLTRARAWQQLPTRPGELEHFTHSDEWATRMHTRVVSALDARVRHPTRPNASPRPGARIVMGAGAAGAEGGPAAVDTGARADAFCVMTDAQRAQDTGATACSEAEFIADQNEARLLASVDAGGHSFGVSKVLLTLVLGQGRDAVLTAVPDAVGDVLCLTCPDLVAFVASPPS
jgi:hypothetical protein